MIPALSPRAPIVAPSWPAVERVLWLAALDRCLRATPGDSARVLIAPIYHPPHRPLVGRGDRRGAPLLGARGAAGGAVVSLRVLTVWQPWATLLVRGIKGPENRGWEPRGLKVGDTYAIHAGSMVDLDSWESAADMADDAGVRVPELAAWREAWMQAQPDRAAKGGAA